MNITTGLYLTLVHAPPGRHHAVVPVASLLGLLHVVVDHHLVLQVQLLEGDDGLGSGTELVQPDFDPFLVLVPFVPDQGNNLTLNRG